MTKMEPPNCHFVSRVLKDEKDRKPAKHKAQKRNCQSNAGVVAVRMGVVWKCFSGYGDDLFSVFARDSSISWKQYFHPA